MTAVARALKAAKTCVGRLVGFYAALSDEAPLEEEVGQLRFPYPAVSRSVLKACRSRTTARSRASLCSWRT
jgi:hypothetical protein